MSDCRRHDRVALARDYQHAVEQVADGGQHAKDQHGAQQAQAHHEQAARERAAHRAGGEQWLYVDGDIGLAESHVDHEGGEQLVGERIPGLEHQHDRDQRERARRAQQCLERLDDRLAQRARLVMVLRAGRAQGADAEQQHERGEHEECQAVAEVIGDDQRDRRGDPGRRPVAKVGERRRRRRARSGPPRRCGRHRWRCPGWRRRTRWPLRTRPQARARRQGSAGQTPRCWPRARAAW